MMSHQSSLLRKKGAIDEPWIAELHSGKAAG